MVGIAVDVVPKQARGQKAVTPRPQAHRRRRGEWPRRYASRLFYSDVFVLAVTIVSAWLLSSPSMTDDVSWRGGPQVSYVLILAIIGIAWLIGLDAIDTRDHHIVGHGVLEYRRLVDATIAVFAFTVAVAFFLGMEISRLLLAVIFPVGLALLLASRWLWRQWLRRRQRKGDYTHRSVIIGERSKVKHVAQQIRRSKDSGYTIVGVITDGVPSEGMPQLEVLGDIRSADKALDAAHIDALIIVGSDDMDPETMRRLGYAVADRDIQMIMAPALTDVAGPRLHSRPVAGLPLVHVDFPRMEGSSRFLKRVFDLIGSAGLLLLFSPVFLVTAIAIKIDGPGRIFYHQERIGRGGRTFGMRKFRSMVQNADDQLASLLDLQGSSETPLFKVSDDPRITKIGRFLRKHSIDELPQLINVLRGEMSLVGPRPQRAAEVALYDDIALRRLAVKPGMSGLWQVSGRSTLSWEETIRLDLYYVENWSLTQDVVILFRTIRAVVAPGASAH